MVFPPPPITSINWTTIGVRTIEVSGHIECKYDSASSLWSKPEFVRDPYLRVHGLATGLNYGQQAYEGMKAYRDPQGQIRIFRSAQHALRFKESAEAVSIPAIPVAHFQRCVHLAVARNAIFVPPYDANSPLYIRPIVFGSSGHLALTRPSEFRFCVFVQPINAYHGDKPVDALILEEFDRAAPNGVGHAKVGGNYAPVMRWSEKANKDGYGITLHLDSKTRSEIEEFSTSGFIGVLQAGDDKYTLVVPDSRNVISSVTSNSCVEMARRLGWDCEVRPIKYEELGSFSEVLAVGTAAGLVPIRSITRRSVAEKKVYDSSLSSAGPCCVLLSGMLKAIQRGEGEDPFGWCETVCAPQEQREEEQWDAGSLFAWNWLRSSLSLWGKHLSA